MNNLNEYQELVNHKAAESSKDLLPNAGKFHAAIAMSKLFEVTKEFVKMVVGNFSGDVSDQDNYLAELESCLKRKIKFEIILLDSPNNESKAYNMLRDYKSRGANVYIKRASDEFINKMKKGNNERHFSIFDNDKFRFENDTKNFLAVFSFNDTSNTINLLRAFDAGFNSSRNID